MSGYYLVDVVIVQRSRKHDYGTLNAALGKVNLDPKTRSFRGDNFEYVGNVEPIAASLSRFKDVERVVVTLVTETSYGVWRRGKRS